jgi:hypothetical protein
LKRRGIATATREGKYRHSQALSGLRVATFLRSRRLFLARCRHLRAAEASLLGESGGRDDCGGSDEDKQRFHEK